MSTKIEIQPASDRELVLCRLINAPAAKLYQAWTEPALLKQWFAPKPWGISRVENDVRSGGKSLTVMKSPDGQEFPNAGIYLEVIPNKKLVFTDAFTSTWEPSQKPFMVGTVTFEEQGNQTRYTARVQHWTKEDREIHEKMGFHEGWGKCTDQLEELASKL
jgi:uncharacterized protein YndB with AHSA1/START domain